MNVLAIGATGFVGARVVRDLVALGHDVVVVHRGHTRGDLPDGVRRVHGDRDALPVLVPQLRRLAPAAVLDVIPYTERHALQLVEVCRGLGARAVVLSSADVYRNYEGLRGEATAPPDPVPLDEEAPLRTSRFPYRGGGVASPWAEDYDKILVEEVVRSAREVAATVLRLPAIHGPGDRQRRLQPYLRRMDDGRAAVLLGEEQAQWRWTRGYVDDVAAAIAAAVVDARAADRTFNLGEPAAASEREWVEAIGAAAGWGGRVVVVPQTRLPAHLRQPLDFRYHIATSTASMRAELGWTETVGRSLGLARTVAWERTQPRAVSPDYAAEDAALDVTGP